MHGLIALLTGCADTPLRRARWRFDEPDEPDSMTSRSCPSGLGNMRLRVPSLTNAATTGYKEEVMIVCASAACACMEAHWAPELTVVSR